MSEDHVLGKLLVLEDFQVLFSLVKVRGDVVLNHLELISTLIERFRQLRALLVLGHNKWNRWVFLALAVARDVSLFLVALARLSFLAYHSKCDLTRCGWISICCVL